MCLRVWSLFSLVATSQPPSVKVLSPGSLTKTLALLLPAGMAFKLLLFRISTSSVDSGHLFGNFLHHALHCLIRF